MSSGKDAATSRTGRGSVNLATIRAAIIAALKDAYGVAEQNRPSFATAVERRRNALCFNLDKPISELIDKYRPVIQALLAGRHIKKIRNSDIVGSPVTRAEIFALRLLSSAEECDRRRSAQAW